jgi:eukaryotic-like serine/threonine-protein kinase
VSESLEDHLRRTTHNFTKPLPEDQVFALGRDLARELARAHAETPPRFPDLEPARIEMKEGTPRLLGGEPAGREADQLIALGALLHGLAAAQRPHVSWRLDGPPDATASTLRRRAVLAGLASPRGDGYATAVAAQAALEGALYPENDALPAWPLFRGTPSRAGTAFGVGPPSTPGSLLPVWQAPLGAVIASPLLATDLVMAGTADGRLLFLDRGTGARLHEVKAASALESSPALLDRTLAVGTDEGELVAVDVRDGRILYRTKLGAMVRSSPLFLGDRVLVGTVENKATGALLALDARSGKPVWRRELGPVFSSPALCGDLVFIGSDDETLYAIGPEKGTVVWKCPLSGRVRATPAVLGDIVVVADFKGRVVGIAAKEGRILWTQELGQPVYSSAALTPAMAVLGCHDGHVYGLDLRSGERVFAFTTGGPVVSSPVAMADRFLAASTDGQLYLLDASGRAVARAAVAAEGIQSSPALDSSGLVIGSGRGLHALRLT